MDDPKTAARWVSAWSTSPIDASLSESGVLDRLGVAVTDVSARTAVQLTAGGTHVRLTLSNIFGVLPLHVAACTIAIGADDARGIDPATLRTVTFGGQTHVRIGAGESCTSDAAALPVAAGQTLVRLDPVDARLAYERSLVALASAVRDNCRLQAQLRETEAAIRMRRVDLRQKADNLTRREALGKAKAIGAEELKHARDDRENAAVALAAAEEERKQRMQPRPYPNEIPSHYKDGSLVVLDNSIGYIRNTQFAPMFHPLELPDRQFRKLSLYVEIRDTYHDLYNSEASERKENTVRRDRLNTLYDDFIRQFGNLNSPKNIDLIRMDNDNRTILSLERYKDGQALKADIFDHPVAFNKNELTHVDTSEEALAASLNKYGNVNLEYMARLTDKTEDTLLDDLKGRVFFNPLIKGYEIADKFIAGNVISKAEMIEDYIANHPGNDRASQSLDALRAAFPVPIPFEELDFNFGERWIPMGIYEKYASRLFDTDVRITYAASRDEFSVNASARGNVRIREQYCVKAESRRYDGLNLMKHAIRNTSPDITKKVQVGDDVVKVRDTEAIQLAKKGEYEQAHAMMAEGKETFVQGHHGHADLLEWQGQGLTWKTNIYLMHAEDQLMAADSFETIASEMIEQYEQINALKAALADLTNKG